MHHEKETIFLFDLSDEKSLPFEKKRDLILAELNNKQAELVDDPFQSTILEGQIKPKHKLIRDKALEVIEPLIANKPAIFYCNKRWNLIVQVSDLFNCNHRTVYKYLRKYWQRGQSANALLPNYNNSGNKGSIRQPGDKKRGRPRKYTLIPGVNISEDMRKTMSVAVDRYYLTGKKFTIKACFEKMLQEFFCVKSIDSHSGLISLSPIHGEDNSDFPTYDQFKYWLEKEKNLLYMKRRRLTPRVYDKDMRGLIGTSNAETWGPGARFQIDATIADVYLVSRINKSKIIGRPVLYVVIDVYSRMIVGIYVGLEGPSYVGAMMALSNTVEDKQIFCRRFGREIEPNEWPCHHLPATLLGDRGEIASNILNNLIKNFNVKVENTAPYRADWKGIVEQRFRLLPAVFKPYVEGYIETDYRERGATDYRLDATLDIDEFTNIIIECVLYYNNLHEIKNYDKDQDLAAADFAAVPIDLWEWGIENKSGSLRKYPSDLVKFSLMPTGKGVITTQGIKFKSIYYTCQKAIVEKWFDKARQNGRESVDISYDPRDMDVIYIHDVDESSGYVVGQLAPRSRAFKSCTSWEIAQAEYQSKLTSGEHASKQIMGSLNTIANIEAIVNKAISNKPSALGISAASRTKAIRENRALEKSENRVNETFRLGDKSNFTAQTKSQNVMHFPVPEDDEYSEPDIIQIIQSGKSEK